MISGETIELSCESTPSYPGFKCFFLFLIETFDFFIATVLEWVPNQTYKTDIYYRNNSADFREITISKLKIKVET